MEIISCIFHKPTQLVLISIFFFQYHKHLFVHIGGTAQYTDPILEVNNIIHKK